MPETTNATTGGGLAGLFGGLASLFTKDAPADGDVHVSGALNGGRKKKIPVADDDTVVVTTKSVSIVKTDEDQRMVYGWASVISEAGVPHVDTQGDVIHADDLVKATTDFMADARMAKSMHAGEGIGEVLHSFPLTADLAKALGVECPNEGWIVGVKVHDDGVWALVKSGELKAFSIGGNAHREEIE